MQTYTRDDVRKASLTFFKDDQLATDVFVDKYALRDSQNNFYELTPADSNMRIAKEFARIEAKYPNPLSLKEIYCCLSDVDESLLAFQPTDVEHNLFDVEKSLKECTVGYGAVIPQGSPQAGIGNPFQMQSLSNCFVIESPKDSYGGICHTDQEQVQIMKRRGGVGFDISTLRPKGMLTTNAAKTTDGIGVFMERFSNTTREVAQGGRRGALMLSINVTHPQIETFINIKRDKTKVTGANVSIKLTDDFMQAVENDTDFMLQWPVDVPITEAKIIKKVKARDIWEQIIDAAWYSAEPGVLFWDTFINNTPSDCYAYAGYRTISTNPCVVGSTLIQTTAGNKTIKELTEQNCIFNVKSYDEQQKKIVDSQAFAFKTKDKAKIIKLTLKNGKILRLTADHLVYTNLGWIRVDQLTKEHKILSL